MKIRLLPAFMMLWITGCGHHPEKAAFQGDWTRTTVNGITNIPSEESISVITDGRRFSINERTNDREFRQIYDGSMLRSQYVYLPGSTSTISGVDPDAPAVSQSTTPFYSPVNSFSVGSDHAATARFWVRPTKGHLKEGIRIAGRWTRLYEQSSGQAGSHVVTQRWLDAVTGVMLQEVEILYSAPTNIVMTQTTYICQRIDYGRVDSKAFQ